MIRKTHYRVDVTVYRDSGTIAWTGCEMAADGSWELKNVDSSLLSDVPSVIASWLASVGIGDQEQDADGPTEDCRTS